MKIIKQDFAVSFQDCDSFFSRVSSPDPKMSPMWCVALQSADTTQPAVLLFIENEGEKNFLTDFFLDGLTKTYRCLFVDGRLRADILKRGQPADKLETLLKILQSLFSGTSSTLLRPPLLPQASAKRRASVRVERERTLTKPHVFPYPKHLDFESLNPNQHQAIIRGAFPQFDVGVRRKSRIVVYLDRAHGKMYKFGSVAALRAFKDKHPEIFGTTTTLDLESKTLETSLTDGWYSTDIDWIVNYEEPESDRFHRFLQYLSCSGHLAAEGVMKTFGSLYAAKFTGLWNPLAGSLWLAAIPPAILTTGTFPYQSAFIVNTALGDKPKPRLVWEQEAAEKGYLARDRSYEIRWQDRAKALWWIFTNLVTESSDAIASVYGAFPDASQTEVVGLCILLGLLKSGQNVLSAGAFVAWEFDAWREYEKHKRVIPPIEELLPLTKYGRIYIARIISALSPAVFGGLHCKTTLDTLKALRSYYHAGFLDVIIDMPMLAKAMLFLPTLYFGGVEGTRRVEVTRVGENPTVNRPDLADEPVFSCVIDHTWQQMMGCLVPKSVRRGMEKYAEFQGLTLKPKGKKPSEPVSLPTGDGCCARALYGAAHLGLFFTVDPIVMLASRPAYSIGEGVINAQAVKAFMRRFVPQSLEMMYTTGMYSVGLMTLFFIVYKVAYEEGMAPVFGLGDVESYRGRPWYEQPMAWQVIASAASVLGQAMQKGKAIKDEVYASRREEETRPRVVRGDGVGVGHIHEEKTPDLESGRRPQPPRPSSGCTLL